MSLGRAKTGLLGYSSSKLFYKKAQMLFADDALYSVEMSRNGLTVSSGSNGCVPYDGSSMNTVR